MEELSQNILTRIQRRVEMLAEAKNQLEKDVAELKVQSQQLEQHIRAVEEEQLIQPTTT